MKGYDEFNLFTFNFNKNRDVVNSSLLILLNKLSDEFIIPWNLTQSVKHILKNAPPKKKNQQERNAYNNLKS